MTTATDVLVVAVNPAVLDADVQALPGVTAVVLGAPDYVRHEGCWVVRVLEGSPEALKYMLENQGYGKVERVLEDLL